MNEAPGQAETPKGRFGRSVLRRWPFIRRFEGLRQSLGQWIVNVGNIGAGVGVILATATYVLESGDRERAVDYQALQVIANARLIGSKGIWRVTIPELVADHFPLNGLDLTGADLTDTDLRGGLFSGAQFVDVRLVGANFGCHFPLWSLFSESCPLDRRTDLSRALFQVAELRRVAFDWAKMKEVHIRSSGEARLEILGVSFANSEMQDARIENALLRNCDFRDADMSRATLAKVAIMGGSFRGTIFNAVAFEQAKVEGRYKNPLGEWSRTDFTEAVFSDSQFNGHPITEADFGDSMLCHTKINGSEINRDCGL